ncbi:MAG: nucleoside deaminase [Granulosicoccus sp.]
MNAVATPDKNLIQRLLDTLADDILPLTEKAVTRGNKVFGAALLRKSDQTTYLAETNNEMESPLHHGEMHLLKRYFELPASPRIPASELIFLSTHEPCSMCLSAITWSGFDNFFYFFSHEDSRDEFDIPHDLTILDEVFGLQPGQYNKQNAFWQCHHIVAWIEQSASDDDRVSLLAQVSAIKARYTAASTAYQSDKSGNDIPLS